MTVCAVELRRFHSANRFDTNCCCVEQGIASRPRVNCADTVMCRVSPNASAATTQPCPSSCTQATSRNRRIDSWLALLYPIARSARSAFRRASFSTCSACHAKCARAQSCVPCCPRCESCEQACYTEVVASPFPGREEGAVHQEHPRKESCGSQPLRMPMPSGKTHARAASFHSQSSSSISAQSRHSACS